MTWFGDISQEVAAELTRPRAGGEGGEKALMRSQDKVVWKWKSGVRAVGVKRKGYQPRKEGAKE